MSYLEKTLLAAVLILHIGGCTLGSRPAAQPVAADQVRIYVLDGGTTRIPDKSLFDAAYSGEITLEVPCFLIVHPRGILLWDSGHSDAFLESRSSDPFQVSLTLGVDSELGELITVTRGVEAQLRDLGLRPNDVTYLAASHWHFDHTGNFNLFAAPEHEDADRSTVVLGQRDEYELAFSEPAAQTFGMRPQTYAALRRNRTDLFIGDRDVFGDGTVRILRAAGHTIGSQVLYVELEEYGGVLLSGDLYHFSEQRQHRRVPNFNHSAEQTLASMDRVETFLTRNPETELWVTHDPVQMRRLRKSPASYR